LRWQEDFGAQAQAPDIRHPHRKAEGREQLTHTSAVVTGEERCKIVEQRMRDGVKFEQLAAQNGRMGGEHPESLVLPPNVLGATLVMRDAQAALAVAAFEAAVPEQRPEDHLDLYRIRHDAPEDALWMLPHTMNVGSALPRLVAGA
jgi:hypothetical protein